jgi:type I restriction enzyme R subunit
LAKCLFSLTYFLAGLILDLFHGIRKAGNAAVHEGKGTRSDALHQLRMSRQLAVWFHRAFGNDPGFRPGPFLPPPDPAQASAELHQELERLRQQVVDQQVQAEQAAREAQQARLSATQEAELRRLAEEKAQAAYADLDAALSLAEESEARLAAEQAQFEQQLAAVQASVAAKPPGAVQAVVAQAQQAATLLDLDEAATRKIIDQQLREAGWEADTEAINFKKGAFRPKRAWPLG